MKVLMLNGSPHKNGTTTRALQEIETELKSNQIECEIIQVGDKNVGGCIACGYCGKNGKCFREDIVNEIAKKMKQCDGLIVGSPVYFASINGTLKSVLDRLFCSSGAVMQYKPALGIVVARRAGTTASLDIINKYFELSNMPIISSQYWNMVHGSNGIDAESDIEGLQTMRILGKNMAWLLKCIELGKQNNIEPPQKEVHIKTNFIRK